MSVLDGSIRSDSLVPQIILGWCSACWFTRNCQIDPRLLRGTPKKRWTTSNDLTNYGWLILVKQMFISTTLYFSHYSVKNESDTSLILYRLLVFKNEVSENYHIVKITTNGEFTLVCHAVILIRTSVYFPFLSSLETPISNSPSPSLLCN